MRTAVQVLPKGADQRSRYRNRLETGYVVSHALADMPVQGIAELLCSGRVGG